MDAITKALNDIKFEIPRDILNLAFVNRYNYYTAEVISLDKSITDNVINAKVLPDLNVVRGQEVSIPLEYCDIINVTPNPYVMETVIKVPAKLLNGRNIITPLAIVFESGPITPYQNGNRLLQTANAAINTTIGTGGFSTTDLELIGNNTVLVHENLPIVLGFLRVMIENDRNMNNLNPRFYNYFSQLCIYATKAYIYNTLIIDINKGIIVGGHELSIIKNIIDSYQDAIENYKTYLKEYMGKILFMNDDKSYSDYVKMLVDPFV